VNGVEWTVNATRKEVPCKVCETPTKGRTGRRPMCSECGMAELMKPIRDFNERLKELVGGSLFK
jgi:hypothetical protein